MRKAETSDRVSSLAADYMNVTKMDILYAVKSDAGIAMLIADIRSMAASLRRQDETPGLRKRLKRALGL